MFIWGRGGVIPLIAFGCALLTELFTRTAFGDVTYYQTHGWPMLVALWAGRRIGLRAAPMVPRWTGAYDY